MSDCPNSDSHGCNFTCPAGGSWFVCPPPTRFIGCCAQDPCENGCSLDWLYPASFNKALYDIISANICSNSSILWYTCNSTTPTFLGCCVNTSNPCHDNGCPSGSLRPAAWNTQPAGKFSNQYSIFLDGGPTASSVVPTTPATASTTSANSASATSTSTVSVTAAPQPSSGLSKGAIAGIAVGVVVALLVIVGLIAIVMYQRGMIAGTRPRASAPNESPELVTKPMEKQDPKHKSTPSYATTQSSPRSTLPPYPSSPNPQSPDSEIRASLASGLGIARGSITSNLIQELDSVETGRRHELHGASEEVSRRYSELAQAFNRT